MKIGMVFRWALVVLVVSCFDLIAQGQEIYGKSCIAESGYSLPIFFIENQGQQEKEIFLCANLPDKTICFKKNAIVFNLLQQSDGNNIERGSFSLIPITSSVRNFPRGCEKLPGQVNYFIGNIPAAWKTGIPIYKTIVYENIFEGVDLRFYGKDDHLEYDLIVRPGADPKTICFCYENVEGISKDEKGSLIINTKIGRLFQCKPSAFQVINGQKVGVDVEFVVDELNSNFENSYAFKIASYDKSKTLIIDPAFTFSTFLGGSADDRAHDIAIDTSGNVYITGSTRSIDLYSQSAYQGIYAGGYYDAFVAKISADGAALEYLTYIGGSGSDEAFGIAVDPYGQACIIGTTQSGDFPLKLPSRSLYESGEAFVAKFNASGNGLVFSTYLGGNDNDTGSAITLNQKGDIYVAGATKSYDFPVKNSVQSVRSGGWWDSYITKIDANSCDIVYSTYLGGSGNEDFIKGIVVDMDDYAYVAGYTTSADFPTYKPFQISQGGNPLARDAFVSKITPDGTSFVYSTYLGGSGGDMAYDIDVDVFGNAYVVGNTYSIDFPVKNSLQGEISAEGSYDLFITKINSSGSDYEFSTYLGGSDYEALYNAGIAIDPGGSIYVAGDTKSVDFPVRSALQNTLSGAPDAFLCRIHPNGRELLFSSYLGGSGWEYYGIQICVDLAGNVYIGGTTGSENFPLCVPLQGEKAGGSDAFIAKIDMDPLPVTGATALCGDTVISLDWDDNSELDVIGYNLYRSLTNQADYERINKDIISISQYQDSGLINFTTYYYKISAVDAALNESVLSQEVIAMPVDDTPPSPPTGLTALAQNQTIILDWNDNLEADFLQYKLYRRTAGEDYFLISGDLKQSGFKDIGLINGVAYYYAVSAVDELFNESGLSAQVSAVPQSMPPVVNADAEPIEGNAPLEVSFIVNAADDGIVCKYEWDFNGDGKYEFVSAAEGDVTYTYPQSGIYQATLRVTDNDNLVTIIAIPIYVENASVRPTPILSAIPIEGKAPLSVVFDYSATYNGNNRNGKIEKYEIDFNGDGVYDYFSAFSGSVNSQDYNYYGKEGKYRAVLRVSDSDEVSEVASVNITVAEPLSMPLSVDACCNPSLGQVPLEVNLSASAVGGSGVYDSYIWDFDGDGIYDAEGKNIVYTYAMPGTYAPTVRVVDDCGLTDTDSCSLKVSAKPELKVWISKPRINRKILGQTLRLHANTAPGRMTRSVQFQYKKSSDTIWNNLGGVLTSPPYLFEYVWDETDLSSEDSYQIRAVAIDLYGNAVVSKAETFVISDGRKSCIKKTKITKNNNKRNAFVCRNKRRKTREETRCND